MMYDVDSVLQFSGSGILELSRIWNFNGFFKAINQEFFLINQIDAI